MKTIQLAALAGLLVFAFIRPIRAYVVDYDNRLTITLPPRTQTVAKPSPDPEVKALLPKATGLGFTIAPYIWHWVAPPIPLQDIPRMWDQEKAWATVTDIHPFTTDSGLAGIRFTAHITREDKPTFVSQMLLLRPAEGESPIMFQTWGDETIIVPILKSIRLFAPPTASSQ